MIPIIYENSHCIVVNKPANMPAQKDFSRTPDMLSIVSNHLGLKAFLIHRLDRHVAGPVVIAKTKASAASLNKQLKANGFTKLYKAVVIHDLAIQLPKNEVVTLNHYLKAEQSKALVISKESFDKMKDNNEGYKEVSLKYKCLNTLTYDTMRLSVLEIELITGRFHQIRSQLKYVGLRILGDPKYGETVFNKCNYTQIGLQSTTLIFKNPQDNKVVRANVEHFDGPFKLFQ